jgi:uncharacterized ion transporter superfamily protein YfcC
MAIACGAIWGLIEWAVRFVYLSLLLAPAVGYAIGEVISLSVNRKRGTPLAVVAGFAVIISYLFSNVRFFQGMILFSFSFWATYIFQR